MMKRLLPLLLTLLLTCPVAHASLVFGAVNSDRADCASGSSLDDLNTWTTSMWIYPTTLTSLRIITSKVNGGSPFGERMMRINGTGGNIELRVERATTRTTYITSNTPISTLNKWYYLTVTYDINGAAGEVANIYVGDATTAPTECTYGTATDGSGTLLSDAAGKWWIGNNQLANAAFEGRIDMVMTWNITLTSQQVIANWIHPHVDSSNVVFYIRLGQTGTQTDLSGNAHVCTITGATVGDSAPISPYVSKYFNEVNRLNAL